MSDIVCLVLHVDRSIAEVFRPGRYVLLERRVRENDRDDGGCGDGYVAPLPAGVH